MTHEIERTGMMDNKISNWKHDVANNFPIFLVFLYFVTKKYRFFFLVRWVGLGGVGLGLFLAKIWKKRSCHEWRIKYATKNHLLEAFWGANKIFLVILRPYTCGDFLKIRWVKNAKKHLLELFGVRTRFFWIFWGRTIVVICSKWYE